MKLIEIKKDSHYIICDDSEIKNYDWNNFDFSDFSEMPNVITHSTQPLDKNEVGNDGFEFDARSTYLPTRIKSLSLSEVQEAINGYNLDDLKSKWYNTQEEDRSESFVFQYSGVIDDALEAGIKIGFNALKELVKDKLFTVEDMKKAFEAGR